MDGLAVDPQRLAAGDEHPGLVAGVEDRVDERGAVVEQVLAVVEDEQQPPRSEGRRQGGRPERGLALHPDRLGDRPRDLVGRVRGGELGEDHVDLVRLVASEACVRRACASARVDLPAPPGPVIVTTRWRRSRAATSSRSRSRPISRLRAAGSTEADGSAAGATAGASA